MQSCFLKILTRVNGEETVVYKRGNAKFEHNDCARLRYLEEGGEVRLELSNDRAQIVRTGDYSLHLRLQVGAKTTSEIGLGGSSGQVETETSLIDVRRTATGAEIKLNYALLFESEKQEMQLTIVAQTNHLSEEK